MSTDGRIVPSKARVIFRQYLPKKPVRWDIKLFAACKSSSYCFDYSIYIGQEIDGRTGVRLTRVVHDLSARLHHQGYVIYTDNFYTFGNLIQDDIQLVGTIKLNRTGVLALLKDVKAFEKYADRGTMRYVHDSNVAYVQWKD